MFVQPDLRGRNDLRVGRKMATFQLFFQSGRAKDLSAPLYLVRRWRDEGGDGQELSPRSTSAYTNRDRYNNGGACFINYAPRQESYRGKRWHSHSVAVDGGERLAARSDRLIVRVHLKRVNFVSDKMPHFFTDSSTSNTYTPTPHQCTAPLRNWTLITRLSILRASHYANWASLVGERNKYKGWRNTIQVRTV